MILLYVLISSLIPILCVGFSTLTRIRNIKITDKALLAETEIFETEIFETEIFETIYMGVIDEA